MTEIVVNLKTTLNLILMNFRAALQSLVCSILLIFPLYMVAQQLEVQRSYSVSAADLPEYVIITSENTKLLGGINITIDYKRSQYEDVLERLESLLQDGDKLRIRNQTDLLNAMHTLGFDFVEAYNATAGSLGVGGGGSDLDVFGSEAKFRTNMVFRKKRD